MSIPELQEKVGARIAGLVGVPAAMVTAGAASAITVATAACMTRGDPAAMDRLPDTEGLKNEVIIQKAHHCGYEPQIEITGARLIWVETRAELDRAITPRTAMMFFLNRYEPLGQIKRDEWIRVGKERGVPLFNDAAADVPPAGRLAEYVQQGFDLVAFSGGKAIRGPQSSGLLLGRPDLIAVGRHLSAPHGHRPWDEGRQGGDRRLAGGRRTVCQARSRRRVARLGNASGRDDRGTRRSPGHDRPGATSLKSPTTRPTWWSNGAHGILRSRPKRSSAG